MVWPVKKKLCMWHRCAHTCVTCMVHTLWARMFNTSRIRVSGMRHRSHTCKYNVCCICVYMHVLRVWEIHFVHTWRMYGTYMVHVCAIHFVHVWVTYKSSSYMWRTCVSCMCSCMCDARHSHARKMQNRTFFLDFPFFCSFTPFSLPVLFFLLWILLNCTDDMEIRTRDLCVTYLAPWPLDHETTARL
jgi:hypothetical protein